MQSLAFQVGDDPVALDIRSVVEVVPRVRLRQPVGGPSWLVGLFVYRGIARAISPGQPVGLREVARLHPETVDQLDSLRRLFVGKNIEIPTEAAKALKLDDGDRVWALAFGTHNRK